MPLNVNADVKNGNTQSHAINANVLPLAVSGGLEKTDFSLTTKFYKMQETNNLPQNPPLQQTAVSSSSSECDWRNDEYNDIDDDEPEHNHEAENCHCGAYKWTKNGWLHVSDCCC